MALNVKQWAVDRARLCRKICNDFADGTITQGPNGPPIEIFEDAQTYATYRGVSWAWAESLDNPNPILGGDKQVGGRCFKVPLANLADGILGRTLKVAGIEAIENQLAAEKRNLEFNRGEDARHREQFGLTLPPVVVAPPPRA
jgi:hypothetical protein